MRAKSLHGIWKDPRPSWTRWRELLLYPAPGLWGQSRDRESLCLHGWASHWLGSEQVIDADIRPPVFLSRIDACKHVSCTVRVCLTFLGGAGPSPCVLASESDIHNLWHLRTGQLMHSECCVTKSVRSRTGTLPSGSDLTFRENCQELMCKHTVDVPRVSRLNRSLIRVAYPEFSRVEEGNVFRKPGHTLVLVPLRS